MTPEISDLATRYLNIRGARNIIETEIETVVDAALLPSYAQSLEEIRKHEAIVLHSHEQLLARIAGLRHLNDIRALAGLALLGPEVLGYDNDDVQYLQYIQDSHPELTRQETEAEVLELASEQEETDSKSKDIIDGLLSDFKPQLDISEFDQTRFVNYPGYNGGATQRFLTETAANMSIVDFLQYPDFSIGAIQPVLIRDKCIFLTPLQKRVLEAYKASLEIVGERKEPVKILSGAVFIKLKERLKEQISDKRYSNLRNMLGDAFSIIRVIFDDLVGDADISQHYAVAKEVSLNPNNEEVNGVKATNYKSRYRLMKSLDPDAIYHVVQKFEKKQKINEDDPLYVCHKKDVFTLKPNEVRTLFRPRVQGKAARLYEKGHFQQVFVRSDKRAFEVKLGQQSHYFTEQEFSVLIAAIQLVIDTNEAEVSFYRLSSELWKQFADQISPTVSEQQFQHGLLLLLDGVSNLLPFTLKNISYYAGATYSQTMVKVDAEHRLKLSQGPIPIIDAEKKTIPAVLPRIVPILHSEQYTFTRSKDVKDKDELEQKRSRRAAELALEKEGKRRLQQRHAITAEELGYAYGTDTIFFANGKSVPLPVKYREEFFDIIEQVQNGQSVDIMMYMLAKVGSVYLAENSQPVIEIRKAISAMLEHSELGLGFNRNGEICRKKRSVSESAFTFSVSPEGMGVLEYAERYIQHSLLQGGTFNYPTDVPEQVLAVAARNVIYDTRYWHNPRFRGGYADTLKSFLFDIIKETFGQRAISVRQGIVREKPRFANDAVRLIWSQGRGTPQQYSPVVS